MRRLLRILLCFVAGIAVVCALFIGIMWKREWQPAPVETLFRATSDMPCDTLRRGDTLRVLSWNIGYAGLGDDMDFFYDGGTQMRTSVERTRENLAQIIAFIRQQADSLHLDMILLQEVDFDSHRSYGIHEYDSLKKALPGYEGWSAWNYVSDFVPIPISSPMRRVKSGLVTFSRWRPDAAIRYAYPGGFAFPVRLFNLKRCLLSLEIPVWDTTGKVQWAYINNTHNTAYDTGNMRSGEMAFLNRFLHGKRYSLTMGDWNSNPPGYTPSQAAVEDPHFSPLQIEREDFSSDLIFVYDPTTPSTRYGYEPYDRATTTTTLLDFGLCGPGIEPVAFETVDLGFRHSDHNPIIGLFVIR